MIHRFFPHKKICEVPVQVVQQALIKVFEKWGIPSWIKVDNGRPFGDPRLEVVPPLALWLIALGIPVIWNPARSPKKNAIVERSQGVLGKWTEFHNCRDRDHLQVRLNREGKFYNYHFPIRKLSGQKRIEAFPDLAHTGRPYQPEKFQLKRALNFLAQGNWVRKVSSTGQISMYNHRFSVGMRFKYQNISLKICPERNAWQIFDATGELIKAVPTKFSKQSLWKLDLS